MAQADLASAGNAPHLSQAEQDLLLSALKSNQSKQAAANGTVNPETAFSGQADSSAFFQGLNDTSFLDSHFDTGNLNWDLDASGLDDLNNDNDNDNTRTSSHFDDGDDDDEGTPEHSGDKRKDRSDDSVEDEEGGKKRRESMEKVAKKPGRKPMTNEPTSKRKAQNRAAQRAFRERKEKHLRDLEQKVEDLEKTSEATNHENGVLRAKVDRLQAELTEYKKQIGTARPSLSPNQSLNSFSWDIGQNLDFEFPKFGIENNASKNKEWVDAGASPAQTGQSSAERKPFSSTNSFTWSPAPFTSSRSMSTSTGNTYFAAMSNARSPTASTEKSLSNSESPASLGLNSSVCTTPESTADSPGQYKNADNGTSTNSVDFTASVSSSQPKTPGQDGTRNVDWFTTQNNNGLFDPILIDAYREPQDNILNNADLNLSFFDDAFPWNPASNYTAPFSGMSASGPLGQPAKASLMDEVEQAAEGKEHDAFKRVSSPADDGPKHITCAKLWERVQRSEKVLNGQADMDDLCMQLKAKAKCGGPSRGAIVDEADVDAILGPDPAKAKATGMLSMFS